LQRRSPIMSRVIFRRFMYSLFGERTGLSRRAERRADPLARTGRHGDQLTGARLCLNCLEDRLAPATFVVSNILDSGAGSLRQAILDANALAGADDIVFDAGVFNTPRTINLTGGTIGVNESLTITGPGAGLLTIDGNNANRIINVNETNGGTFAI